MLHLRHAGRAAVYLWILHFALFCSGEQFTEHVIVHQLSDQYSAVTFAATGQGQPAPHQQSFPLPIASLFNTYPLQSFHLSLSRGRWRKEWCVTGSRRTLQSRNASKAPAVNAPAANASGSSSAAAARATPCSSSSLTCAGVRVWEQCHRQEQHSLRPGNLQSTASTSLLCGTASRTQWQVSSAHH